MFLFCVCSLYHSPRCLSYVLLFVLVVNRVCVRVCLWFPLVSKFSVSFLCMCCVCSCVFVVSHPPFCVLVLCVCLLVFCVCCVRAFFSWVLFSHACRSLLLVFVLFLCVALGV